MNSISAVQWWCSGVMLNRVLSPSRSWQVAQEVGPPPNAASGDHAAADQAAAAPTSSDAGNSRDGAG
jgi:hypothetical protein